MTREEASKILRIHQECLKAQENGKCKHHLIARCEPCEYYTSDEDFNEAESMAISSLQKIDMLEKLTETHKQSGHAPTRTISMEDLKEIIE